MNRLQKLGHLSGKYFVCVCANSDIMVRDDDKHQVDWYKSANAAHKAKFGY